MGCPLISSELRAEWGSDLRVEQSSDSKGRAEWSSETQKCVMGCPLTFVARTAFASLTQDM